MNSKSANLEKYTVAPSPSRDYYGIKVYDNEVILYQWKISHGPHPSPTIRSIKFKDFENDKSLKDEINYVFGPTILHYLELLASNGNKTLLTLPKDIIEKLIRYLSLKDIATLLCASPLTKQLFDTNEIWEILFKRCKRSSKLTEMEKDLATTHGFKKLAKDHHVRSMTRRTLRQVDEKTASRSQKVSKPDRVVRSASVNLPKTPLQEDVRKMLKKQSLDDSPRKEHKLMQRLKKTIGHDEATPPRVVKKKSLKENLVDKLDRFEFVNEDNERTELILPKEFLKSAMLRSELTDTDIEELIKRKGKEPNLKSVNLKSKSTNKESEQKKKKKTGTKPAVKPKSTTNLKSAPKPNVEDEDSDESGMSYLMKKYLEASNEVARKFTECKRVAAQQQTTVRNSGIQVDINVDEPVVRAEQKSVRRLQRHSAIGDNGGSVGKSVAGKEQASAFSKLRSLKKN